MKYTVFFRNLFDNAVLFVMNAYLYFRHPVWMVRTAVKLRRLPNVAAPGSFREKRMWRLIFDRNPLFTLFGDKLATKAWMADHAPELICTPTIWVARTLAELPANVFAKGVVIKANSGCNQNIFLDNTPYSNCEIQKIMRNWMKTTYYENPGREYWPKLSQKIFAEKIITNNRVSVLDFSIFCCDGQVLFVLITLGEKTDYKRKAYFSPTGQRIFSIQNSRSYIRNWLPSDFQPPMCFGTAVKAATRLTTSIDFVRVDIMCANEKLYTCEMTPFPSVGAYMQTDFIESHMREWDLQKSWFIQAKQKAFLHIYQAALRRRLRHRAQEPQNATRYYGGYYRNRNESPSAD